MEPSADLVVQTILSHPFEENSYVVHRPGRRDALVIDPGLQPGPILAYLEDHSLRPALILNTHGHADHIAGNRALKQAYPDVPLVIGRLDAVMLRDPNANLSLPMTGLALTSPEPDRLVDEGAVLAAAGLRLEVVHIPGHSPGHVVFVERDVTPPVVFGGDVLFAGSIGRFDFPGGDAAALLGGIRAKLWPLPEATVVYPGHGPATTIGQEKRTNVFLRGHESFLRTGGTGPTE